MSLIEFDGYFKGKFEPFKYTRLEVHTSNVKEVQIVVYPNNIRTKLTQMSVFEFNNKLLLVIKARKKP